MSAWTPCGKSPTGSDYTLFRLDDQHAHERVRLTDQDAWLLVRESDSIVEFAVFEFHDSNTDGSSGPYGALCPSCWRRVLVVLERDEQIEQLVEALLGKDAG